MIWEVIAYLGVATVAGCLIAAVSALVWGPGAVRQLSARLKIAENRIEDVDDRISSEVKKRAGEKGRLERSRRATDAELTAEAQDRLLQQESAPDAATGRVATSGVFPIRRK